MADAGPNDTAHERSREHGLAHGLLLEAVDCLRQASELIDDEDRSATLSRHAEELTRLAGRLSAASP